MNDIRLHPLSRGGDLRGRLYMREDHLLRGIHEHAVDETVQFLTHPETIAMVNEKILVPAEIIDEPELSYPLVLRHPWLPRITFPHEWTAPMLKEAGMLCLDALERSAKAGFLLDDMHAANIVFRHTRPMFIDYGSFVTAFDSRSNTFRKYPSHACFINQFILPLELMASGHSALVRSYFLKGIRFTRTTLPGMKTNLSFFKKTAQQLASRLPRFMQPLVHKVKIRNGRFLSAQEHNILATASELRKRLERIRVTPKPSKWLDYQPLEDLADGTSAKASAVSEKLTAVVKILERISFTSVTDLGCNRGLHAMHFAKTGIPVIAIDTDDSCISEIFLTARRLSLPITPVLMSAVRPSPTPPSVGGERFHVSERLSSDLVLCLALMHHMVLAQRSDFFSLFESIALFTGRFALVEFVPADDETIKRWPEKPPSWYTEEKFVAALQRRFSILRTAPSNYASRKLYLLERRKA